MDQRKYTNINHRQRNGDRSPSDSHSGTDRFVPTGGIHGIKSIHMSVAKG